MRYILCFFETIFTINVTCISCSFYDQINNIITNNELETELPTLNINELKSILINSGVKDECLEKKKILEKNL